MFEHTYNNKQQQFCKLIKKVFNSIQVTLKKIFYITRHFVVT